MIESAILVEAEWASDSDWESLGNVAVRAALAATRYAGLQNLAASVEISVRLTSDDQVRTLNRQYRGKDKPTNVLSFPMVQPDLLPALTNSDDGEILLGDIVLAYGVCVAEAKERGVSVEAHASHLIVHGTLHLLGYDHMDDSEAEAMEAMECAIMVGLGLHDPYAIEG